MHEGVSVFVEEGDWYIQFQTRCKNLREDNLCGIYEDRPKICADYEPGSCDYAGGDYQYDQLFTHPKQIEAYYERRTGKKLTAASPSKQQASGRASRQRGRRNDLVQLAMR
jgi:Fe-S-cluster containining protein